MTDTQAVAAHGKAARDATVRAVKFWTCSKDVKELCYRDISEAVASWAEDRSSADVTETVTVYGFAEMELPPAARIADYVLDNVVEYLDDEYGDRIYGDDTHITPALKAAALAFAEAVRDEYPVWSCEEVTSVVVNVADHIPSSWLDCFPSLTAPRVPAALPSPESPDR